MPNVTGFANPVQMEHIELHFHRSEDRLRLLVPQHHGAYGVFKSLGFWGRNTAYEEIRLQTADVFGASRSCSPTSLAGVFFCPRGVVVTGVMINQ